MAKLDLRIEFDQRDRTCVAGGELAGAVHVQVHGDVGHAGLWVQPSWRAHGKGNTHEVDGERVLLREGPWRAGEATRVPFRLDLPAGPPSYRGSLFEVTHTLRARLDVPWALDPKVSEDFVLLPGPQPHPFQPPPTDEPDLGLGAAQGFGVVLGGALALFGLLAGAPVAFLLVPVGVGVAFYAMRRQLARMRLGLVELRWGSPTVAPGDELPVELALTPSRTLSLNGVHLTLTGTEVCVKGGGKNRKVHRHVLASARYDLDAPGKLAADVTHDLQGAATIPHTAPCSFLTRNNRVHWKLQLSVELPGWPDWIVTRDVVVVPREQLSRSRAPTGSDGPALVRDAPSPPAPTGQPAPPALPAAATEPPAGGASRAELVAALDRLAAIEGYGGERDALIAELAQRAFDCAVEVRSVERTYTPRADRVRGGRTLVGTVEGTEHAVAVQLPESENEAARSLARGARWGGRCLVTGWNLIHRRAEMVRAE